MTNRFVAANTTADIAVGLDMTDNTKESQPADSAEDFNLTQTHTCWEIDHVRHSWMFRNAGCENH